MQVLATNKTSILHAVKTLQKGGAVVYPTDTSYGLGVDAMNLSAVKKLYKIKRRGSKKPVHVVVSSQAQAQKLVRMSPLSVKLFKNLLPGPLTLVLRLKAKNRSLRTLSAGTGSLGIRMPKNNVALRLVRALGRPITATSANPSRDLSGGYDAYSAKEVILQFRKKKHKPDLVLDGGRLRKVRPSSVVAIVDERVKIIREGPISKRRIENALR
ncbi:MAG: threonylcarbamoyl-AMP synthase [Candidatus Doudnabacteria bacterium RIFCSPHIGHO2_01_FULL_50_11]|uniref:L-threonylcarbamoyladenylate synthase n=1 Tax=Candidatus Doudnabacteria bacterium RIFCSPHIGHO2_01_FULL_50_11 TaxID=1817828 RepID=A0A1F5PEF5_9BACT|nr:MAG: threonylcarbamoyl-AMP synthase [Candidatus Doudnabacteria bacterium RIFCSPHIGHO2_01_FULL_50_11]HLC44450.1 L-threonylcarbamoyladenylate synthase [Patescibacteria group bacterium]